MGSDGFGKAVLVLIGRGAQARSGPGAPSRRPPALLLWCAGAAALTSIGVQVTGRGIDVLVVVLLCCAVVLLERTLGDWLADLIGSALASVAFAAVLGIGVWMLFADGGKAEQFYAVAESRGYHTLYHHGPTRTDPDAHGAAVDQSAPSGTTSTGGSSAATLGRAPTDRSGASERGTGGTASPAPADPHERRGAGPLPVIQVEAPEMAGTGRNVTIRARVTAGGVPLAHVPVEFTINGSRHAAGTTDPSGAASTAFVPRFAGTYRVEARVTDGRLRQPSARTLLYVVPGISSLLQPFAVPVSA